ncbi:MAG: hypothetical protein M5U08_22620 [Burkholderiales bacterium]|nr:hypothetical protein [Burkholderiales bacterium]
MAAAGREITECMHVLEKAELNLVGEVLRGHGTFYEHEHYPPQDVYDHETHAQYYYHAHRGLAGEHGHFHTFVRAAGMPEGVAPVPYAHAEAWPRGEEALAHLVGISMDPYGRPVGLFTVNRWVTADAWYPASDVIRMLDRFAIEHAYPSWPVNRWISAMLRFFRPQIEVLLHARDASVAGWAAAHPGVDVFEDRALEVTSALAVTLEEQFRALAAVREEAPSPGMRAPAAIIIPDPGDHE